MPNNPIDQVTLENIAQAMAAAAPDADSDGRRIIVETYRLLTAGEPVSTAEIATAAGVTREKTEAVLRAWNAFFDADGRVFRFWGMAIDPLKPRHQIEVDGHTIFGWCAWDTLFITELLRADTTVRSTDPVTGDAVKLTVTPDGVSDVEPDGVMMSFLYPDEGLTPDVVMGFCHSVHFFASETSGLAWTEDHPRTFLLSMPAAFELGRLANRLRWGEIDAA